MIRRAVVQKLRWMIHYTVVILFAMFVSAFAVGITLASAQIVWTLLNRC